MSNDNEQNLTLSENSSNLPPDILDKANQLLSTLQNGDLTNARHLISSLNKFREVSLYQELGKLTRELHETIKDIDVGIENKEVPAAKNRLSYVIELTEKSATLTMDKIEETIPPSNAIAEEAKQLLDDWSRFKRREMNVDEFKDLYKEMMKFLESVQSNAELIHDNLQEIILAQNYQDLTGQAIRKVMDTVSDLEKRLVHLVAIAAEANSTFDEDSKEVLLTDEDVENQVEEEQNKEVSGQDEVDDLLSSLGF